MGQDLEEHPLGGRQCGTDGGVLLERQRLACVVVGSAQQPVPSSGGVRTGFSFGTSLE